MYEETKCTNRVTLPNGYCHLHKKNNIVPIKKKLILPKINKKILLPTKLLDIIQDCPICLCEIEKDEEDTGLICRHKFHVDCLNHIEKSECPVCRGPLEFINSSKVDINKIKHKEEQEMLCNEQKQIIEDRDLGRRIRTEEENEYENNHHHNHNHNHHHNHHNHNHHHNNHNHNHHNNHHHNNHDHHNNHHMMFDMSLIIEELEKLEEIHQINQAIENSLITSNINRL
jgi:hypothetical protein